jgi:hypothetical protein
VKLSLRSDALFSLKREVLVLDLSCNISYTVLHRVKEEKNIVHTIKRRKANWIGHILRRNCLLKLVIEGKLEGRIEMTGRRGRRRKKTG